MNESIGTEMGNIYLIGMMGSGKSVTGKELSALIRYDFVDLDDLIQAKAGRTISEIFATDGEPFFRDEEAVILRQTSQAERRVVATGGGIILQSQNTECMRQTGKIVYLETTPETLWSRIRGKKDRPLLKSDSPKENLMRVFAARAILYKKACDFSVSTDSQSADAVARAILKMLPNSNEKN